MSSSITINNHAKVGLRSFGKGAAAAAATATATALPVPVPLPAVVAEKAAWVSPRVLATATGTGAGTATGTGTAVPLTSAMFPPLPVSRNVLLPGPKKLMSFIDVARKGHEVALAEEAAAAVRAAAKKVADEREAREIAILNATRHGRATRSHEYEEENYSSYSEQGGGYQADLYGAEEEEEESNA